MKPDAFEHALDDIEVRLERLFALYDQFLAGDERVDPLALQRDIGRRIARLNGESNAQGAAAARLRSILERHENFRRYWERLSRRMKSGAHQGALPAERPPSVRAPNETPLPRDPSKRRTPPLGTPAVHEPWGEPPNSNGAPTVPMMVSPVAAASVSFESPARLPFQPPEIQTESEQTPTGAELARRAAIAQSAPSRPSAVTAERVLEIQSSLLAMDATSARVSFEQLKTILEERETKLRAQHGDRTITFDVVMKDGKAVIKPIVH